MPASEPWREIDQHSDVVRLNYYTIDADGLLGAWNVIAERLGQAGCRPTITLLGVNRLASPEMLIGIEATALPL